MRCTAVAGCDMHAEVNTRRPAALVHLALCAAFGV